MSKPKRLWKNLKVKKISILTDDWNPANGAIALFKSQGNLSSGNPEQKDTALKSVELVNLCKVDKQDAEEGLLYVTVAKISPDSDGDAPESLKELKKAAHDFTKAGNMGCVDHNHDMKDMAGCEIVQSYVDEASGEWKAVIDINGNETMMQKARDGQISGVSFFGPAEVSPYLAESSEISKKASGKAGATVLEKSEKGLFERFIDFFKTFDDQTANSNSEERSRPFPTLTKGEVEMKIEDLDKHLAEKYGFKPLEQSSGNPEQKNTAGKSGDQKKEEDKPAGDTAPDATAELEKANKRIEQLEKSVETLAKGRNTNGDLGGEKVTLEMLAKCDDPAKLAELYKKFDEQGGK